MLCEGVSRMGWRMKCCLAETEHQACPGKAPVKVVRPKCTQKE